MNSSMRSVKSRVKSKINTKAKSKPKSHEKKNSDTCTSNMSFSHYVDQKPHMKEHRRKIKKWVSDDSVKTCKKCEVKFSSWTVNINYHKHHCRVCGKIFCGYCSSHTIKIPKEMIDDIPEDPYSSIDMSEHKVRACDQCISHVVNFNKFYNIIKERKLDFDIFKLASICQRNLDIIDEEESDSDSDSDNDIDSSVSSSNTRRSSLSGSIGRSGDKYIEQLDSNIQAAIYCVSKLRDIQYKLPTDRLTQLEKELLWANRQYFCGHSKWLVQMLKIIDYKNADQVGELDEILSKPRKHKCWDTMCTRYCTNHIELIDLIDVLHIGLQHPIINKVIKYAIKNADREETIFVLPLICYYISGNSYLLETLLRRYEKDNMFMSELFWCIKMYNSDKDFIETFRERIKGTDIYHKIIQMEKLLNFNPKTDYTDIITPIDPSTVYDRISKSGIVILSSTSKPMVIPFVKENNGTDETTEKITKRILFKREDVRKDHIISNLINMAHGILVKAKIIDIDMIKYKICPMTNNSGMIEIVEDAETMCNIIETEGFTIQNYINEHNEDRTNKDITDRFMQSAAMYCILIYLLGVGDRHKDNIMISKSGLLFHIDFGYILGKDPKYSSNHIRFAPDLLNVIGGTKSKNHPIFKKYCVDIYKQLRLHINVFMSMLLLVTNIDNSITKDSVRELLLSRFEVGESSLDAAIHMDTKINKGGYTTMDKIIDTLYTSKKTTLSKGSKLMKGLKYVSDFGKTFKSLYK